jgi:hypothetical protein
LGSISVKIQAADGRELWSGVFAIQAPAAKKAHKSDQKPGQESGDESESEASQSLVAASSRVPGRRFLLSHASLDKLKFEQVMKSKAPAVASPPAQEKK